MLISGHINIMFFCHHVWAHKTSLTPPLFIEVPVPSQKNERSCICVLGISIFPFSTILTFDFGINPT